MKYIIEFVWGPFDGEVIQSDKLKEAYYIPYRTSYETIKESDYYFIDWHEMVYEFEEIRYGKYRYRFKGWQ